MLKNKRILILDDEEDICFLLKIFLDKEYEKVDFVHDIKSIGEKELNDYDLLFLDNNLPDGYGFDLIPSIKQKNKNIKIIAISAFDTSGEQHSALIKGADIFIGKPFNRTQILEQMNIIL